MTRFAKGLCTLVLAFWIGPAGARQADDVAGRVVGEVDGRSVDLPMQRTDLDVDIQGDIATVRVTQEFANPSDAPMSAEYLFPLNQSAAVYAMEMRVGNEVVQAVIKKKKEAEETFEQAKSEGKSAALLTQHRPNMFTQKIANLMPGLPVTVTLSYVQAVPEIDGAYELVVPLIVGPRYEGAGAPETLEDTGGAVVIDGWSVDTLPAYPQVVGLDLPETVSADRVALDLSLNSAVPVVSLTSATHDLALNEQAGAMIARFADGRTIDNRDLVVRYVLGGEGITAGVLSHRDSLGGFVSLMIEPPRDVADDQAIPRELVFVLDTSGSMNGAPIAASKDFMDASLKALRPDDTFQIIQFANSATHFANSPLPATPANLRAGRDYVRGLAAGGGTEIDKAIRTAFATRPPRDRLRIVVFLSDGYIGDEARVLRTIRQQIGNARLYAFGVGSSVNRYLLDAMAEEGRGYVRYADPTETGVEAAEALARDLRTPLLTDIAIDWGTLTVSEVTPRRIPDIFDGNAVRVLARYTGGGPVDLKINGLVRGHRASLPLRVDLPDAPTETATASAAIPLIWARERIADLERSIAVRDGAAKQHEAEITRLGLAYSLQSRFTSFVAVSRSVVNPGGEATPATVPLPMVAGVEATAYPSAGFSGSSTPEPRMLLGLFIVAVLGALRMIRHRRDTGRASRAVAS